MVDEEQGELLPSTFLHRKCIFLSPLSHPERGVLSTHAFPFRKRTFSSFFPFSFAAISSTHATTTPEPEGLFSLCVSGVCVQGSQPRPTSNKYIFERSRSPPPPPPCPPRDTQPASSSSFSLSLSLSSFSVFSRLGKGERTEGPLFSFPFSLGQT